MAAEVRTQYADHPEWGDEVLRTNDDSVKHPMEINLFMACLLSVICFVGFPLNWEIIIRILYNKTMRLKPRYVIQLAVAFSDVFILLAIVVIVAHFCLGPNELLCNIFVSFFMGIAYNCFLLNHFLSLLDCFVAIVFPLWHFTRVTARRVVNALIGLNLTLALAVEWPFISGTIQVRCALQPAHGIVINGTSAVLFTLCLVFCCVDFAITWFHLHRSPRNISVPPSVNPTVEEIEMQQQHQDVSNLIWNQLFIISYKLIMFYIRPLQQLNQFKWKKNTQPGVHDAFLSSLKYPKLKRRQKKQLILVAKGAVVTMEDAHRLGPPHY